MELDLAITGASLLLLLAATACGGADSASSQDAPPVATTVSPLSYGEIFALVTTSTTINGEPAYELGAKLTRPTATVDACAGATVTKGACCYVPAAKRVTTKPSTGLAGQNADGSPTYVDESAGTLTLADATSGAKLGAVDYGPVPAGFGVAQGYPNAALNPTLWNAGDVLHINAAGEAGHLPAFSASVHGVGLPEVVETTSLPRSTALSFSWKADPNATSMTLTLSSFGKDSQDSHGTISCKVDDAAGKLSVDPSLLAHFASGDLCWGYLDRAAVQHVEIAGGHVSVVAKGEQTFIVPVE